jgi:AcrR family transcriptional regulator
MPKVVSEYKDLAKKRIIDAAYKIFYRKGYLSSTMNDVAKEVGVSKGSLYSYFKSKEELLQTTSQLSVDSFNDYFYSENSLEPLEEIYNDMLKSIGSLHLDFQITALSYQNKEIQRANRNSYKKKLDTLKFFVENQQKKGNIRGDVPAGNIAQLLIGVYTDIAMQLIIGIDKTQIHESWKNSLSTILEENHNDQQKTLNSYFSN